MQIANRATWHAREPRQRLELNWPEGVTLWVHHSAGNAPADLPAALAETRAIQDQHMRKGWNDIGYAYLVSPGGVVIEGRGRALGAHSPGKNHEPSVCMLGDYSTREPSDAMRRGISDLVELLRVGDLAGHRENTATTCPGDAGMREVVNGLDNERDDLSMRQRLIRAGYGPRSADYLIDRIRHKQFGTVPNLSDSRTFRRLRDAGFGVNSARLVIRAGRRNPA